MARTAAHTPRAAPFLFVARVAGVLFYLALLLAVTGGRVTRALTLRGVVGGVVVVFADGSDLVVVHPPLARLEERVLVQAFGEAYARYMRRKVRRLLTPWGHHPAQFAARPR